MHSTQMAGSGELTRRINTMDWKVIDRTYRNWEALRSRNCYVSNGWHFDFAMFQTHLWLALLCFKIVRSNICMCTNTPKLVSSGFYQAIKMSHSEFIARPFFPQLQFALVCDTNQIRNCITVLWYKYTRKCIAVLWYKIAPECIAVVWYKTDP